MDDTQSKETIVAVIGLGYVGLPVAVASSAKYRTIGFDVSQERIQSLQKGEDKTQEVDKEHIEDNENLLFTDDQEVLKQANVYIVTVPTPIDENNVPDMTLLEEASRLVGSVIKQYSAVIFESTVYPGATEEVCIPRVEKESGMKVNTDFWVGYSPERINPGMTRRKFQDVVKVTSGSCPEAAEWVDSFYQSIVAAGTHRAPSIQVAEAAKVIENIQRDINIALFNEFAQLFDRLGLDTGDVIDAADTKWNFLPFQPGLVGGHCIGVDPYYLTHKARQVGFNPEVTLAGRRVNNSMPDWITNKICSLIDEKGKKPENCHALMLGITYKQDVPDVRNSKAVELVRCLRARGIKVDVFDPIAEKNPSDLPKDIKLYDSPNNNTYDVIILAVGHAPFVHVKPTSLVKPGKKDCIVYDVKHILPKSMVTSRL